MCNAGKNFQFCQITTNWQISQLMKNWYTSVNRKDSDEGALRRYTVKHLTLNAPITTKVVCFSHLLKCLRSLNGKQCGPRSGCSYRSTLLWVHAVCFYTSILNSSVMLGNFLQQTTSADDIFRCIFLCFKG